MPRRLATGRPTVPPFASSALDAIAAAAETALVDTCTITRPGGDPVYDPETMTYTEPAATTVYSGACLFGRDTEDARTPNVAEESVPLSTIHLYLPLSATGPGEQHLVTCTASHDGRLDGRTFTVIDVGVDSVEPFRALLVQEEL